MHRRFWFGIIMALIFSAISVGAPARAQGSFADLLTMTINAGYDTFYRPDMWLPIRIDIENNGNPVTGDLLVRPATSGAGIEHTYTTPIELQQGRQSLFLYITARDLANNVRVELVNQTGETLISSANPLRSLLPRDSLFVVVSGALNSRFDLSDLHPTGYNSYQIRWRIPNIPDRPEGLKAVTMLIVNDIDTDQFSLPQRDAIRSWVIGGGHLVVMGGSNWQATASGLNDLLPFSPTNNITTTTSAETFLRVGGYPQEELADLQTTIEYTQTLGSVRSQGHILASDEDGNPYVVRQTMGNGTVDYITMNLEALPFADMDLSRLFSWLISTAQTPIGWSYGFSDWSNANTAVQILPGVDLLPAVLSLIGFLGAYILLIGPINYLALRAINRRGLAWVTIPILIGVFTVLAWSVGIELRGTDARLSRLTVVQAWHNTDEAHIDQLLGLLAPRRGNYTLILDDERSLRPLLTPRDILVLETPQTNIEIRQTSQFAAIDVPVDASFISAFSTSGVIEKPNITGSATWVYRNGLPLLRGSVRNNADFPLTDVVILARGMVRPLGNLDVGAVLTFETDSPVIVRETAMPAFIEFTRTDDRDMFFGTEILSRTTITRSLLSARDLLGEEAFASQATPRNIESEHERQRFNRQRALIASFMVDQYASRARGNRVFLIGWSDTSPTTENLAGQGYIPIDTTVYIIEIATEIAPTDEEVIITKDQFTWTALPESGISNISPSNLTTTLLDNTIVAFRFTPIAEARLETVTSLTLLIERTSISMSNTLEFWDWEADEWVAFAIGGQTRFEIPNHTRFIGAQNAVHIRTTTGSTTGSRYIQQLGLEQRGTLP